MKWFRSKLSDNGVLGINGRNLDYIFPNNRRRYYPYADSKLATKKLAQDVGVNTPELIAEIQWQYDVKTLKSKLGNHKQFVIKPDHGSGGGGIIVIKDVLPIGYKKSSGNIMTHQEIAFHCQNILSGMFSLGGQSDTVLIEKKVNFDPVFDDISFQGVPDIRVIVARGQPLMGMLRLPTEKSDGKANLHLGGIGVGIDMKTGKTTYAVQHNRYLDLHPETGYSFKDRDIPYWQDILDIAVKMQQASQLNYIGVDIVLDEKEGPLVLEINARPGISIQIANKKGIRKPLI